MKKILLILLSCFCMGTCVFGEDNASQTDTAVESSAHQSEKKEAEKWLKKHMAKSKKVRCTPEKATLVNEFQGGKRAVFGVT